MAEPTSRRVFESPVGPMVTVDGRHLLWFGGTAYLGLQSDPAVIRAAQDALARYGLHAGSARAGYGTSPSLLDSEAALCALFGTPAALHVASGWAAGALMLAALPERRWRAFHDASCHDSAREALHAFGLPCHAFVHRDPEDLRAVLHRELQAGESPLVMTDGVFAGTGALAPLVEYRAVLAAHGDSALCVDDAHGFGVLGGAGRGTLEHLGIDAHNGPCRLLVAGTASKALGGHGGVLADDAATVERARIRSPWHAGSTPPTVPVAAATATAVGLVRTQPERRTRLHANTATLRAGLAALGMNLPAAPTPILAVPCRDAREGERRHEALRGAGILVPVLSDYGGLHGTALRIAVFATHEAHHLEQLLDALRRCL
ncbi:MAG: pyridoxal phosphate-dependent aminotransferase family protein [Planctomycetota bacterium]